VLEAEQTDNNKADMGTEKEFAVDRQCQLEAVDMGTEKEFAVDRQRQLVAGDKGKDMGNRAGAGVGRMSQAEGADMGMEKEFEVDRGHREVDRDRDNPGEQRRVGDKDNLVGDKDRDRAVLVRLAEVEAAEWAGTFMWSQEKTASAEKLVNVGCLRAGELKA
jgi:hypothetical protein